MFEGGCIVFERCYLHHLAFISDLEMAEPSLIWIDSTISIPIND